MSKINCKCTIKLGVSHDQLGTNAHLHILSVLMSGHYQELPLKASIRLPIARTRCSNTGGWVMIRSCDIAFHLRSKQISAYDELIIKCIKRTSFGLMIGPPSAGFGKSLQML